MRLGYRLGYRLGDGGLAYNIGGAAPRPPLDATTIEYWDAELGITLSSGQVQTWTGMVGGLALSAPSGSQRPLYADSSKFRNTKTVQCTVASSRCLINTAAGTIVANASRPWTISVYALSAAPGASVIYGIISLGVLASQDRHFVHYQTFGGSQLRPYYNNSGVVVQATATADTTARVVELWPDGTNLNCRDNGALFTTSSNVSLGAACTSIAFGRSASAANSFANVDMVFHMICSAKPSDAYITALKRWLADNKGTTP